MSSKKEIGNIVLALALIRSLYNKEEISRNVYKNIEKECNKRIKKLESAE